MRGQKAVHSDEWGAGAARFSAFVPWVPLIFFGLVFVCIAVSMTNPLIKKYRKKLSLPTTTKWTTLKWRLILMAVALITLIAYNLLFLGEIDYNLIARCSEDTAAISLNPEFGKGDSTAVFVFYYLPIFCAPLFLLHGIWAAAISYRNRRLKNRVPLDGLSGIPQTLFILCLFCSCFSAAKYAGQGLFVMADMIPAITVFFVAGIPWIFFKSEV